MAPRINIPPVTRTILSSLCAFSVLYGFARWTRLGGGSWSESVSVPYLVLVPERILFYPWTLATATFVESNIFALLISGATIFYGGKYLERAWGSREFGKFVVVVSLLSNVVMVVLFILSDTIRGHAFIAYV